MEKAASEEEGCGADDVRYTNATWHAFRVALSEAMIKAVAAGAPRDTVGGAPVMVKLALTKDITYDADYLPCLPPSLRQEYTCSACRRVFNKVIRLGWVDTKGAIVPLWPRTFSGVYRGLVEAVSRQLRVAWDGVSFEGVYIQNGPMTPFGAAEHYGRNQRGERVGPFGHFWFAMDGWTHRSQTAGQRCAELTEGVKAVQRSLEDPKFADAALARAEEVLNTLSRAHKEVFLVGQLRKVRHALRSVASKHAPSFLARTITEAPVSLCHINAGCLGAFCQALHEKGEEHARCEWAKMKHPLAYQRPQALPKAGNLEEAERVCTRLGVRLGRRFAGLEDLRHLEVWRPREGRGARAPRLPTTSQFAAVPHRGASGGGGGRTGTTPRRPSPAIEMTWAKFRRTVLSEVDTMESQVLDHAVYGHWLTASEESAPYWVWDRDGSHMASFYVHPGGSYARSWGFRAGAWVPVSGIHTFPWLLPDGTVLWKGREEGIFIALQGAHDTWADKHTCIFPAWLHQDLKGVRSSIEAMSKRASPQSSSHPRVGGYYLPGGAGGSNWKKVRLRVTTRAGSQNEYILMSYD